MNNPDQNMDEVFRDAFDGWDAPHSGSELHADWAQLSAKLGAASSAGASAATGAKVAAGAKGIITAKLGALVAGAGLLLGGGAATLYLHQMSDVRGLSEPGLTGLKGLTTMEYKDVVNPFNPVNPGSDKGNPGSDKKRTTSTERRTPDNNQRTTSLRSAAPFAKSNGAGKETSTGRQEPNHPTPDARRLTPDNEQRTTNNEQLTEIARPPLHLCAGEGISLPEGAAVQSVSWGDGTNQKGTVHVYNKAGEFSLVYVTQQNRYEQQIVVTARPEAHFNIKESNGLILAFSNLSEGKANAYLWEFGDGKTTKSVGINPVGHTYNDTGRYKVRLVARSGECTDTSVQEIVVTNHPVEIPNVITPNGDGKNDYFDIAIEGESSFELVVMDRQGATVFRSNDKHRKWNGTDMRNGRFCSGSFFFVLRYSFPGEAVTERIGQITVIR